ncbi:MAG TPA: ABC transporter ATP-binding protein [Candidatus Lokiarchaeia archaeon]|nr:ABC transporter ATP-binding protein [Candidatus Lokiarchaeia archaeon]
MTEPIVDVKDLVKKFKVAGSFFKPKFEPIINGMTFSVQKGDHVAIIGTNGSGKTTLMKILAGIYLPDAGTVKVHGYDITKQLSKVLNRVSFVSPALTFLKKLTLRNTIDFFAKSQGMAPEPAYKFVDEFGISSMLDELLEVFSEGQKALTRFAIAFIKEPDVMLIDEVTANLDMMRKEQVLNYLAERKDAITFIIIDHDVTTVDRLSNKILMLKRGGSVMKLDDVNAILKTIPYRYIVDVLPKRMLEKEYWGKLDQPWRDVGSHVQFICQTPDEVTRVNQFLLDDSEIISMTNSGLSIEDIYYYFLINEDYKSSEGIGRISYDDATLP